MRGLSNREGCTAGGPERGFSPRPASLPDTPVPSDTAPARRAVCTCSHIARDGAATTISRLPDGPGNPPSSERPTPYRRASLAGVPFGGFPSCSETGPRACRWSRRSVQPASRRRKDPPWSGCAYPRPRDASLGNAGVGPILGQNVRILPVLAALGHAAAHRPRRNAVQRSDLGARQVGAHRSALSEARGSRRPSRAVRPRPFRGSRGGSQRRW